MAEAVVIDASALVDLLLGGPLGQAVAARVAGHGLHGPAHLDAEVLSALGRLHRAGELGAETVGNLLGRLVDAPIERHPVAGLVEGAWRRRETLRLADAVYVELAARLRVPLVTTDARLRPVGRADVVST
jgi:predicted nucleic acid-binding protein